MLVFTHFIFHLHQHFIHSFLLYHSPKMLSKIWLLNLYFFNIAFQTFYYSNLFLISFMSHISDRFLNNKYLVFINYSSMHVNSNYYINLIELKLKQRNLIHLLDDSLVNMCILNIENNSKLSLSLIIQNLGVQLPKLEATTICVSAPW